MKLIIGLGNPGVRYENTRHNAGFMVLDRLAQKAGVQIDRNKYEAKVVKTKIKGEDVLLMKPETFMNNSGFALRQAMNFYKLSADDVIVVYDDMDTPVGEFRLRQKGSAGGHNGMKSVQLHAMSDNINRVRVGIGRNPLFKTADYVLSRFQKEEMDDLDKALDGAAAALWFAIDHPFEQAMNRYNKRNKKPKAPKKKEAALDGVQEIQASADADTISIVETACEMEMPEGALDMKTSQEDQI